MGFAWRCTPFTWIILRIGYGVAQLVPNVVAQMTGCIAYCAEKGRIPSIQLFFSIYGVHSSTGQVYFDTRIKGSTIVDVKSSNSGYHRKWVFVYGPDLEYVKSCGPVSRGTLDFLNGMDKYDSEFICSVLGKGFKYSHYQFKRNDFMESHNRKG